MKVIKSTIPFNYKTIKVTQSRIDKGLLAIPASLSSLLPQTANNIRIIDENGYEEIKTFTPYKSSSRECRIGGMASFYSKYSINSGDEIVIQFIDEGKIRLLPEKLFIKTINNQLDIFENNDKDIENQIEAISKLTNTDKKTFLQNEFVRLSNIALSERKTLTINSSKKRESVPASLRKVLLNLYNGKCQLTDFSFLQKNGLPYFEIHHIDAEKGNHVKNLLVVSPNIHAQFTYANIIKQNFDDKGWLREVVFDSNTYPVFQIIDKLPNVFEKELHL